MEPRLQPSTPETQQEAITPLGDSRKGSAHTLKGEGADTKPLNNGGDDPEAKPKSVKSNSNKGSKDGGSDDEERKAAEGDGLSQKKPS
jgi:hypothetical protein